MGFRTFQLKDLFTTPVRGASRYTRAYGRAHAGPFPVYSASNRTPLTHINSYDFDGEYLTVALNGYAGFPKVIEGKFSVNADRAVLEPLDRDDLHLHYIAVALTPVLRSMTLGRIVDGKKNEFTKISPEKIIEAELSLPVDEAGRPSIAMQVELLERHLFFERFRARLVSEAEALSKAIVSMDGLTADVMLLTLGDEDHFRFVTQKTGWTRRDLRSLNSANEEDWPVYSAARGPVAFVSVDEPQRISASPTRTLLSFGSNGDSSAGTNFVLHNRDFYISNDRTCIDVVSDSISPEYLLYSLQTMKTDYGFNHALKATVANVSGVTVTVPTDSNGAPSLERQRDIVGRLKKYYMIRDELAELGLKLAKANIEG